MGFAILECDPRVCTYVCTIIPMYERVESDNTCPFEMEQDPISFAWVPEPPDVAAGRREGSYGEGKKTILMGNGARVPTTPHVGLRVRPCLGVRFGGCSLV